MGNPGGSLRGDWEGEEVGDAERRPMEKRGGTVRDQIPREGDWRPPPSGF